jgi:serine/threonine protein kinase
MAIRAGVVAGRTLPHHHLFGRGGMGQIYRVSDITLNQPVALKFLPEAVAKSLDCWTAFTATFALPAKSRIPMSP